MNQIMSEHHEENMRSQEAVTVMSEDDSFVLVDNFPEQQILEDCVNDVSESLNEYPEIKIYGKVCKQRRCVGFFSDVSVGYQYSNQRADSKPMTDSLNSMLTLVNSKYNANYNGILVNKYKTGEDYISAHSDDERNLHKTAGVVSISYGATRKFRIRSKKDKKLKTDFKLFSGVMLQMGGNFQKEFTHEIPVEKRVNEERISFTFRNHNI
jgi:alkylated DNA repair dioxygenase AlkB